MQHPSTPQHEGPQPDGRQRIGFVGLGVMGEAMCRNLVGTQRFTVTAYDRDPAAVARLEAAGAARAGDLQALAGCCDVIILCLPGGREVEQVCLGEAGAAGLVTHLQPGQTLIDMSTSPPALMRQLAQACAAKGAAFADAPIARTRVAAAEGTLAIMVGADATTFDAILPVLRTMGTDINHCGDVGCGQVVKLMNNMVLFQTVQALAEAHAIAQAQGVDPQLLFETLAQGSADSFALRHHGMKAILPETFPLKAFSVAYAAKDLNYARALAAEAGLEAPGAAVVAGSFTAARNAGDGDRYFPVIRKALKRQHD
ncbi:MAG: NAD(P)-dependent oxidoreductase [Pseudomonadota bacterium]